MGTNGLTWQGKNFYVHVGNRTWTSYIANHLLSYGHAKFYGTKILLICIYLYYVDLNPWVGLTISYIVVYWLVHCSRLCQSWTAKVGTYCSACWCVIPPKDCQQMMPWLTHISLISLLPFVNKMKKCLRFSFIVSISFANKMAQECWASSTSSGMIYYQLHNCGTKYLLLFSNDSHDQQLIIIQCLIL